MIYGKEKLKQSIIVLLLIFSTFMVFAGGKTESMSKSEKPIELTFWSLFTGGDGEFFDAMIKEFNKTHPDIILKSDTTKFTDYYTKLTTALSAKNAPDIVVLHRDNMLPYVQGRVLYPLDEVLQNIDAPMQDFVPSALNACKFDGKLYLIPLDVHPLIMYYNKDLLKKAGISTLPQTYSEFIKAAQIVQEKTNAVGIAMDNTTAVYKAYTLTRFFISGMGQMGGSILDANAKNPAFYNEKGKEVVQALVDMANKYRVMPQGYDYDSSVTDFKLGKAAFHFNGVWATGAFEQEKNLNFGAVPFPPLWGKAASWGASHTLAIPVQKKMNSQKIEAAVTFMLWMTEHGDMWAKAGHIPTRFSVREKDSFKSMLYRPDYVNAAETVIMAPNTLAWDEIYSSLSDMLEYAVANNQSSDITLKNMNEKVQEILSN